MSGLHPDAGEPDLQQSIELLECFYTAVSRAQQLGYFKGPHGPLEETAWVHVGIQHLEDAQRIASEALDGDVRQLSHFRTMIAEVPVFEPAAHREMQASANAKIYVPVKKSVVVAAAGLVLDEVQGEGSGDWMLRAMNYYRTRAAAVQSAFSAADLVLSRKISYDEFARTVSGSSFLPGHAHGMTAAAPADAVHADSQANAAAHQLDAIYSSLLESAASGRSAAEVLQRFAANPRLDSECCGCMKDLADHWQELAPKWKEIVFRPVPPEKPKPFERPAGLQFPLVPGVEENVTGGQWEIAQMTVHETDDLCPPAQGLKNFSGKVYGAAGSELVKAQNEWIDAKECFDGTDTKRCLREEDDGYNKCTEEEDQGYNECSQEEDQGYRDCCDWIPCSWACDAWVWISNIVCVVWTWISNIVCVVWTWIKKIVCVAWDYTKAIGCAIGHVALAGAHVAAGIGGIVVGAVTRTVAGILGAGCKLVGAKPSSRTVSQLKVVGIHIAVLHTNKVLLFAYDEGNYPVSASNPADFTAVGDSDRALCALWDPNAKTAHYLPLSRNLFCAHQSFTEDGKLFVAGGQFPLPGLLKSIFPPELLAPGADKDLHLFDPVSESWSRLADMQRGRWYPTCATLPNGKVFISSGTNGYATSPGFGRGIQDTWQMADPMTGDRGVHTSFGHHLYHLFPFQHVLPDGRLFIHFKRTTILFDPKTSTTSRIAASGKSSTQTGETRHPYSRTGPGPGTCCLLPLVPKRNPQTGKIEYPAGKIMILGGGGAEKEPEPADPTDEEPRSDGTTGYNLHSDVAATNTVEILDFSKETPDWEFTTTMHNGRVMPDSILLPDAKVLVLGGGRFGQSGGLLAHFTSTDTHGQPDKGATDPVFEPELYDPEERTWTLVARKPLARLYHTTAALLSDGRVMVAGHDGALNMPPFDESRYEIEIFSPPYLFNADGTPANRPVITDAPAEVPIGQSFVIKTPNAAETSSVCLIRQSSTTHQINSDQRYVGLFILDQSREQIVVQAPPAGGVAPPGYYMLFISNRSGVPSVSRWIRVPAQR